MHLTIPYYEIRENSIKLSVLLQTGKFPSTRQLGKCTKYEKLKKNSKYYKFEISFCSKLTFKKSAEVPDLPLTSVHPRFMPKPRR